MTYEYVTIGLFWVVRFRENQSMLSGTAKLRRAYKRYHIKIIWLKINNIRLCGGHLTFSPNRDSSVDCFALSAVIDYVTLLRQNLSESTHV